MPAISMALKRFTNLQQNITLESSRMRPTVLVEPIEENASEPLVMFFVLVSMALRTSLAVKAALCVTEYEAMMARQHNDANILCLGRRVLGEGLAKQCLLAFLNSEFLSGGHLERVRKIEI